MCRANSTRFGARDRRRALGRADVRDAKPPGAAAIKDIAFGTGLSGLRAQQVAPAADVVWIVVGALADGDVGIV